MRRLGTLLAVAGLVAAFAVTSTPAIAEPKDK